jgi:two-component system, chemotaxis family, CheB/CheR fusion protein
MIIFSEQDVIKDPPFSKLDLISCRNLLIYMNANLQKKIIPLFHYALNPGGTLLMGSSETVGEFSRLFVPLDQKWKIYRRQAEPRGTVPALFGFGFPPTSVEYRTAPYRGKTFGSSQGQGRGRILVVDMKRSFSTFSWGCWEGTTRYWPLTRDRRPKRY